MSDDALTAAVPPRRPERTPVPAGPASGPLAAGLLCAILLSGPARSLPAADFLRGDANQDQMTDMSDAVVLFSYLFLGDKKPTCLDAADANDTGEIDISDGIYVLNFLFVGGKEPPPPYPAAGPDPTPDTLGCEGSAPCKEWVNSVGMRFVYIAPGSFLMGSPDSERGRWYVEGPVHKVNLTRGFYMGVTEVTQGAYEQVMGENPSFFHGGIYGVDLTRPVETVNPLEAVEFCRRLSDLEGRTYRLPTEAEWEYACRAGTTTRFSFGDALDCNDECIACPEAAKYVWWCANDFPHGTKPVGTKAPNPWCLYDMHGNVSEWCQDWTGRYSAEEVTDPQGPSAGEEKVTRGGYWNTRLVQTRSAIRSDLSLDHRLEYIGFRVVRDPELGE